MDPKHCRGCNDDYYNQGGNSFEGKCWSLDTAKLVTRYRIGTWTAPTESGAFTEMRLPNCYRQQGASFYDALPSFVQMKDVIRLSLRRRR